MLTANERNLLGRVINSEFHDGNDPVDNYVWSVCDNLSDNAVMGSLVKKGLVVTEGKGCDLVQAVTQAGVDAYNAR